MSFEQSHQTSLKRRRGSDSPPPAERAPKKRPGKKARSQLSPEEDWARDWIHKLGFELTTRKNAYHPNALAWQHLSSPEAGRLDLFTDGSGYNRDTGVAGWAVVRADGQKRELVHFRSGTFAKADRPAGAKPGNVSPFEAEFMAVVGGIEQVCEQVVALRSEGRPAWTHVVIFSDSPSILGSIGRYNEKSYRAVDTMHGEWLNVRLLRVGERLRDLGVHCKLCFVKGHRGVPGNEAADRVAKAQAGYRTWDEIAAMKFERQGYGSIKDLPFPTASSVAPPEETASSSG
ncbi:hypothetical protein SLS56_003596 [Neofusicoccum ribis]|uniref:RNase H type-1 domain-containing protein n=1 Tax=Neofusicoccum ribis TaxID=45134 RepID=A0ABR3SYT8_9PEZI